jgi:hypothetical protein
MSKHLWDSTNLEFGFFVNIGVFMVKLAFCGLERTVYFIAFLLVYSTLSVTNILFVCII